METKMADKNPAAGLTDMFKSFGENLQLPGPDINQVVDYHRKNIQAMQDAAQIASSGAQAMMAKQREQLEATLAEVAEMVKSMGGDMSDPSAAMSKQSEFARRSFEATIRNVTDMGEILKGSSTESFEVLKSRVEDSIEELKSSMTKKS